MHIQFKLLEPFDAVIQERAKREHLSPGLLAKALLQEVLGAEQGPAKVAARAASVEVPVAGKRNPGVLLTVADISQEVLDQLVWMAKRGKEELWETVVAVVEASILDPQPGHTHEITRQAVIPGDEGGRTWEEAGLYPDTLPTGRRDQETGLWVGWPERL